MERDLKLNALETLILMNAIRKVESSIKLRHKFSEESEINTTLYDLQDYLHAVSVGENNTIEFRDNETVRNTTDTTDTDNN